MSAKVIIDKIKNHPDRDEVISKLLIGIPVKDIYEWLDSKYSAVSERKFVIAEKALNKFKDDYLDIYTMVQQDLAITKAALKAGTSDDIELNINNLPAYQNILVATASKELDIRETVRKLCIAIETRLAQVFDQIQENPRDINTRIDRLLIDYMELFSNVLEKYYKFTEGPTEISVNHNVTLQVVDQHITVFHDVVKEILSQMDMESSLYFMEIFKQKMSVLQLPEKDVAEKATNPEIRLAEAEILSETINKKLS